MGHPDGWGVWRPDRFVKPPAALTSEPPHETNTDAVKGSDAGASRAGRVCNQAQAGQPPCGNTRYRQHTMPAAGAAAVRRARLPTRAASTRARLYAALTLTPRAANCPGWEPTHHDTRPPPIRAGRRASDNMRASGAAHQDSTTTPRSAHGSSKGETPVRTTTITKKRTPTGRRAGAHRRRPLAATRLDERAIRDGHTNDAAAAPARHAAPSFRRRRHVQTRQPQRPPTAHRRPHHTADGAARSGRAAPHQGGRTPSAAREAVLPQTTAAAAAAGGMRRPPGVARQRGGVENRGGGGQARAHHNDSSTEKQ